MQLGEQLIVGASKFTWTKITNEYRTTTYLHDSSSTMPIRKWIIFVYLKGNFRFAIRFGSARAAKNYQYWIINDFMLWNYLWLECERSIKLPPSIKTINTHNIQLIFVKNGNSDIYVSQMWRKTMEFIVRLKSWIFVLPARPFISAFDHHQLFGHCMLLYRSKCRVCIRFFFNKNELKLIVYNFVASSLLSFFHIYFVIVFNHPINGTKIDFT